MLWNSDELSVVVGRLVVGCCLRVVSAVLTVGLRLDVSRSLEFVSEVLGWLRSHEDLICFDEDVIRLSRVKRLSLRLSLPGA